MHKVWWVYVIQSVFLFVWKYGCVSNNSMKSDEIQWNVSASNIREWFGTYVDKMKHVVSKTRKNIRLRSYTLHNTFAIWNGFRFKCFGVLSHGHGTEQQSTYVKSITSSLPAQTCHMFGQLGATTPLSLYPSTSTTSVVLKEVILSFHIKSFSSRLLTASATVNHVQKTNISDLWRPVTEILRLEPMYTSELGWARSCSAKFIYFEWCMTSKGKLSTLPSKTTAWENYSLRQEQMLKSKLVRKKNSAYLRIESNTLLQQGLFRADI